MEIQVSPKFILNTTEFSVFDSSTKLKYDFHDRALPLMIFRDRMDGWFFQPARSLLNIGYDVAAIIIVTPLVEALQERYEGNSSIGKSSIFFKRRAKIIFNLNNENALQLLYNGLRCGFAHHGFLKDDTNRSNILITKIDSNLPIIFEDDVLKIDPDKYINRIIDGFLDFYNQVNTDDSLREKLVTFWNKDWQMSLRVPGNVGSIVS